MSSDEYYDDDFDASFMNALDAYEAAQAQPSATTSRPSNPSAPSKPPSKVFKPSTSGLLSTASGNSHASTLLPVQKPLSAPKPLRPPPRRATPPDVVELNDSSDYDNAFDDIVLNDADFACLDRHVQQQYDNMHSRIGQSSAQPTASGSRSNGLVRRPSKGAQLNLFGEVVQESDAAKSQAEPSKRTFQRTRSSLRQMPLPGQARRTKQWDRTAYAKTGWRKPKDKGKERAGGDEDDEPVEFEQFPAPELPVGPVPPMKLSADRLASKTWIYPLNKPKRDYQYNIVKKCLLENTLVALPTGLGKTFIAGVVMLNFYNWFPEGKVVFVAPTKPLVAQQIDACHKACGIPGSAAAELTGTVSRERRTSAWRDKRVFYATPQTLLNDLIGGYVDALDIILLVIDEAHRGTGDYAYAQVVRYMMQHNPHFRLLALTATPGGKPEAVQEIVDALHISHIEIRSESDSDLKKYLHTKFESEHFVQMTDDIARLRDGLAAIMTPIIKKVQSAGFLKNGNTSPTMLHPFRCQSTMGEMRSARAPQYAVSAAAQLGPLARAMGYLVENSTSMCYKCLKDICDGDTASKKALAKMDSFQSLMKKFEEQAARGFSVHPKMELLKTLLIDHFAKQLPDSEGETSTHTGQSRAMVFVSFRECVEEIVELLNKESPIIRAKAFIGQSTDNQGRKGYAQKEQLEVIKQFKGGKHNVLVSTSIGEEGLDIGEVDVIVCYDAQKTPIRMLQRIGRTGRKASGTVHILLAQGREEHNWQKAQSNYEEVQHFIVRASDLEVYGDVDRLIPDDIEPECVEMEMEIEEYVREERASRKTSFANGDSPKGKKRKRDNDPMRNVPEAATKGFVSVKDLIIKGSSKRKKKLPEVTVSDLERAEESDTDDADIEAGIFGVRRTKTAPAASEQTKGKGKKKAIKRSTSTVHSSKKAPPKAKAVRESKMDASNIASEDDSDDEAIEQGPLSLRGTSRSTQKSQRPSTSFKPSRSPSLRARPTAPSSPDVPLHDVSVIDLSDDAEPAPTAATVMASSPDRPLAQSSSTTDCRSTREESPDIPLQSRASGKSSGSQNIAWSSSPDRSSIPPERSKSPSSRSMSAEAPLAEPPTASGGGDDSLAWLVDDDDDLFPSAAPDSSPFKNDPPPTPLSAKVDGPYLVGSSPRVSWGGDRSAALRALVLSGSQSSRKADSSPIVLTDSSPVVAVAGSSKQKMGPPALPPRFGPQKANGGSSSSATLVDSPDPPPATFAVRAPNGRGGAGGKAPRKRPANDDDDVLDLDSSSPIRAAPRRLRRGRATSPTPAAASTSHQDDNAGSPPPSPARPRPKKRQRRTLRDAADAARRNPWINLEAAHSGSERSAGSDDAHDAYGGAPDSDDVHFLAGDADADVTQASPSYDQRAVYRQSLMTQAPRGGGGGPVFARAPARRGGALFGRGLGQGSTRGGYYGRRRSSSPTVVDEEEPDEYVEGSFVVDDDAEISFEAGPSSDDF